MEVELEAGETNELLISLVAFSVSRLLDDHAIVVAGFDLIIYFTLFSARK